ncbi:hypothetical protein B566_EDAN010304 [Ephemera danica]|nr:hypothetical protein B566_EDAN010304 [Ephemera danica]
MSSGMYNTNCISSGFIFLVSEAWFLGVWYEIARFSHPAPTPRPGVPHLTLRPMLTACVRLTFSLKDNGQLRVERSGLDANGKLQVQVGEAAQGHAEHARLFFKYPGEYEEDLGVVEADYEDHALLYGCHLTSTGHVSQNSWILARDQTLDEDTTQILKAVLSSRHVDISQFTFTRQDDKCQQQNPDNATIITLPGDIGV